MHHKEIVIAELKEKGNYFDVESLKKTVKKDFKKFLKDHYNINLLSMSITYTAKSGVHYYFKADQDLPDEFRSRWASDSSAQMELRAIYKTMERIKNNA